MAPSTLNDDVNFFDQTIIDFGQKTPRTASGNIVFAGAHWPDRTKNTVKYTDVETAIREARAMTIKAYLLAKGALRGNEDGVEKMTRWFGPRNEGAGINDRDWWKGAIAIIGAVEDFIVDNVHVYYRGDKSLLGKATDYPGEHGKIKARDISGFAESSTGSKDNRIGLCKLFFAQQKKGGSKMKLRGSDSAGGTLVHELSHNICATEDHSNATNTGDCYGTADCLQLAASIPSRAFYNADNIEYFCEDAQYSFTNAPLEPVVTTGALRGVGALRGILGGQLGGLPVSASDWQTKTARALHYRSTDLKNVDAALAAFESTPNGNTRAALKKAFNTWYDRNPKERTKRNVDDCVTLLKNFLG